MVILNLRNMHFMMRKNYHVLQTSHFGVCKLREGEKENVLDFSYLFVRIIKKFEKKYTSVQAPPQINQMSSFVGGMVWMCHPPSFWQAAGLRRKREGELDNTAQIWLNSQRFTYLRWAVSPPHAPATHSANLHYLQP